MESFYGELPPRKVPNPTSFLKSNLDPLVPEVSIIFEKSRKNPKISYNAWKYNSNDKENTSNDVSFKKQVRFEPKTAISETFLKTPLTNTSNHQSTSRNSMTHTQMSPLLKNELELSLLDNRRVESPQQIFNYKNEKISFYKNTLSNMSYHDWLIVSDQEKQKQEEEERNQKVQEATIHNLFNIVRNQNETLKTLQKQVELLLQQNIETKTNDYLNQFKKSFNTHTVEPCTCKKTNTMKTVETNTSLSGSPVQISIGIMTSFEVNINQESNGISSKNTPLSINDRNITPELMPTVTPLRYQNKPFVGGFNNFSNNTVEGFSRREYSLCEIPEIPEPLEDTVSTSDSIHVELQEYNESSDEEESDKDDADNHSGWTVYNNVVGQVQNILEKSPRENVEEKVVTPTHGVNPTLNQIENIKRNTLNQLHELGISSPDLNIPMVLEGKHCLGSNDLSIEVNQLVMKYLRDDQLSFLVAHNQRMQNSPKRQKFIFPSPPNNNIGNEMSFATVKYMQKYRLWSQNSIQKPDHFVAHNVNKLMANQETPPVKYRSQNKILDITALKQQPKLL